MGHLVNPTGFRLGFLHNWKDNWITTNSVAYAELLHNIASLKEAARSQLYIPKRRGSIIYSHFNIEQQRSNRLFLRVYYYDSDIELKYRDIRYACRRVYFNQRRLYLSIYRMYCYFLPGFRRHARLKRRDVFYNMLERRGIHEYLLLRKLISLFLCAIARDNILKENPSLLLQAKAGIYILLEYNWRKNLFYGKPLNFFEFFLGVFTQMQFFEKGLFLNAIRASLFYFQKLSKNNRRLGGPTAGKTFEVHFLAKWFRFGRMNLIQKLLQNRSKLHSFVLFIKKYERYRRNMPNKSFYKNDFVKFRLGVDSFLMGRSAYLKKQNLLWRKRFSRQLAKRRLKQKRFGWNPRLEKIVLFEIGSKSFLRRFLRKNEKLVSFFEKVSNSYVSRMSSLYYWLSANEIQKLAYNKSYFPPFFFKKLMLRGYSQTSLRFYIKHKFQLLGVNRYIKGDFIASFKEPVGHVSTLSDVIDNTNTWSLLVYVYLKYSHNLWYNSSETLKDFLRAGYIKYLNLHEGYMWKWQSLSIWATILFLDFYRLFLARAFYVYKFGFQKLQIEAKLNQISLYPVELEFFGFDNDWVTAPFIAFYLSRKFEQGYQIRDLFKPICRDLRRIMTRTPFLLGYKLQFVGRLTRRDRLRTSWTMGGRVPLSTMSAFIEFGNDFGILRNGVCSIRVWLYRPKHLGDPAWSYLYKVVY